MMAVNALGKGVEFICAAAPDVPAWLRGDPDRLRQVLINLAGNAFKFTHRGEVFVWVSLEASSEAEVRLRFSVRDTGIGIPAAKLGMLFQKFTQLDGSTTQHYGGTGLGLAISKQLAGLLGGEIGAKSEHGKGSEFWFTARFARPAEPPPAAPERPGLRGARVLVVDDNATHREVLGIQLVAWGMAANEAADGASALRCLRQARQDGQPFKLALLDMHMPDTTGLALGQAIHADAALAGTILVMMISRGHDDLTDQLERLGSPACLIKPLRPSELLDCLARSLAGEARPQAAFPAAARPVFPARIQSRARILLAEDDLTNQQVALAILRKLGLNADIAANGREALDALGKTPYDLVLMDVQMPVLGGLEAAREIRNPESPVPNHAVPIIAMTARALSTDREQCLAAGMNDYISKPVDPRSLAAALITWLPKEPLAAITAPSVPAAVPAAPAPGSQVYDREGLRARTMGDPEVMRVVKAAFLEDLPGQIRALAASVAGGEAARAAAQAHRIKSAAANMGGEELRQAAAAMEKAGREGDLAALTRQMPDLQARFERLKTAIEMADLPPGAPGN